MAPASPCISHFPVSGASLGHSSSSLQFLDSSVERTSCYGGSCRCVYVRNGTFYRDYCIRPKTYLCGTRPGGDRVFYTPALLDRILAGAYGSSGDRPGVFYHYWIISLLGGAVCVCAAVLLSYRLAQRRRALDATDGHAAAARCHRRRLRDSRLPRQRQQPQRWPSSNNNNFAHFPEGAGVVMVTIAGQLPPPQAQPPPPQYDAVASWAAGVHAGCNGRGGDVEEKPPTYEAAIATLGAGGPP